MKISNKHEGQRDTAISGKSLVSLCPDMEYQWAFTGDNS